MARSTTTTPNPDVEESVDPVDQLPNVTISGSVSAVLSEAVEDYKWSNRKSRADVLNEALTEWAERHDLLGKARDTLRKRIANP